MHSREIIKKIQENVEALAASAKKIDVQEDRTKEDREALNKVLMSLYLEGVFKNVGLNPDFMAGFVAGVSTEMIRTGVGEGDGNG